jgi:ribonuclease HI
MKVRVFTDGGCTNNGKNGARAAYGFWIPEHTNLSDAKRVPDDQPQTNNRGELLGILEGIKCVKSNFPASEIDLHIYTDSQYSKNCLTIWIQGWVQRGWKTADGKVVCNRDLIEDASMCLTKFKSYTLSYVAAHTGKDDDLSKNNHIVDRMVSRVLNPEEEVKIVTSSTQQLFDGFPIHIMGPPVSERTLLEWCHLNLNKLDKAELDTALMSALTKTAKKNGFNLEKQKLHRTSMYRLTSSNHLIAEASNIVKEE